MFLADETCLFFEEFSVTAYEHPLLVSKSAYALLSSCQSLREVCATPSEYIKQPFGVLLSAVSSSMKYMVIPSC